MTDTERRVANKPISATVRALETPEQTIAAIGDDLAQRARAFESARDPRCVFAQAYARLSHELAGALPGAGFSDPEWVARLGGVFAGYYLRALHAYDARALAPGAWATVFHAAEHGRTSVIEDLVLGMTAHIVNDLPQALCDVGLRAPDGSSRIADYHRLNDVLGAAIGPIQDEISRRYDPWLHVLDQLFEHYDEILSELRSAHQPRRCLVQRRAPARPGITRRRGVRDRAQPRGDAARGARSTAVYAALRGARGAFARAPDAALAHGHRSRRH